MAGGGEMKKGRESGGGRGDEGEGKRKRWGGGEMKEKGRESGGGRGDEG